MRKIILLMLFAFLSMALFYQPKTITMKGSDTMVILAQRWAEKYMGSNPGIIIQVNGGGTGTGIAALINGTTDICNSSRPMKPSEREKLKQRYNSVGVEIRVARDGLSLYVNNDNPVKELTKEQIKNIFLGRTKNWKEVGGNNSAIIIYGRENSSGTYVHFKEEVLNGEDYTSSMQSLPGTAAVVNAVSKDKNAIGFGGAAYAVGVRDIAVKANPRAKAYIPTDENIKKGLYPISRLLYLYVRNKPTGELKKFIDWMLSNEGQGVVSEVGYFPIR
jgi:phosphate transport system substrate-binding protein